MTIRFTNLKGFDQDILKFAALTQLDAVLVRNKLVFDLFDGIVKRTPVDTGTARASWLISKNKVEPAENKVDTEQDAVAKNNNELSSFSSTDIKDVVFITNSLPYILPLENGLSKQADKGFMVQRTLNQVQQDFKQAFGLI